MASRNGYFQVWLLLVGLVGLNGVATASSPGVPAVSPPKGDAKRQQSAMHAGMVALYERAQPDRAVGIFREVLAANPTHYGANYQLAVALDAAGRPAEAVTQWGRVLEAAQAIGDEATAETAGARSTESRLSVKMKEGMDLVYGRSEPGLAVPLFRQVLAEMPSHYGANFQLARALERSGELEEAGSLWKKVITMAKDYQDRPTEQMARDGLQSVTMADLMRRGMEELYQHGEPVAAAGRFRSVLDLLATHYGATYQLATALDAAKRPDEARPLWTKVLAMARTYNDQFALDTARQRLGR